jgi:RNA polymerase sigma factor (sigma-70 family)
MNAADPSAAFRRLHDDHGAAVRRATARLLREPQDVEDVVQDTFLRAFLTLRRRPVPAEALRPWLVTVARNRAIDLLRARRPTAELGDRPSTAAGPDARHELRETVRETVAAVRRLPEAQRRALVLHAVDGEPYEAVARELRVSPAAAKALAWRGRDAVRREIAA